MTTQCPRAQRNESRRHAWTALRLGTAPRLRAGAFTIGFKTFPERTLSEELQIDLSIAQTALSIAQTALNIAQMPLNITQITLSIAEMALSIAQMALIIAQMALSITEMALSIAEMPLNVAQTALSIDQTGLSISRTVLSTAELVRERNVAKVNASLRAMNWIPGWPSAPPPPRRCTLSFSP